MFNDESSAREQILKDKHTLLEGYVVEYLYRKQFLSSGNTEYTSGWWFANMPGKPGFFFVVTEDPNKVDREVINVLSPQFNVLTAYPEGETWYFHQDGKRLDLNQFLEKYDLKVLTTPGAAERTVRDIQRQQKCLSFFESHDMLRKVAIERNFADSVLSSCFPSLVNIDCFIQRRNGKLCVIEVKFKNKTARGTFGMNRGQYQLFKRLSSMGFEIQNWILYKKQCNKKDISVFDFLHQPGNKWWMRGMIDTEEAGDQEKTAPEETSVTGNRRQSYVEFDANGFDFIAPLNVRVD